jgi:hypothetical protein
MLRLIFALDENGDGFSDVWIWHYNYSVALDGATTDVDGDGASAKDENDFGSDPGDPSSHPPQLGLELLPSDLRSSINRNRQPTSLRGRTPG